MGAHFADAEHGLFWKNGNAIDSGYLDTDEEKLPFDKNDKIAQEFKVSDYLLKQEVEE